MFTQRALLGGGAENSRVIDQRQGKEPHTHSHSPQTSSPAVPQQINISTVQVQDTHGKKAKRPSRDSKQSTHRDFCPAQPSANLTVPYLVGEQMDFCSEILNEDSSENANIKSTETLKTRNKCAGNRRKSR